MPRLILAAVLLLAVAISTSAGPFEDGLETFRRAARTREAGNESAARTHFREAAKAWEGLAADGPASTRLYTNIGNARAFAGDLGEAVLAYRRALVVDRTNARARDALESIRPRLGIEDRAEEASTGLVRTLFFWHDALDLGTRRLLFGLVWILGLGLGVASRRLRRLRIPAGLLLAAAAAVFVSLAITDSQDAGAGEAVLVVRTEGRTGNGAFYSPSHTTPLPAGVELTILETRAGDGGWVRARLRDGTTSWLPTRTVVSVVP